MVGSAEDGEMVLASAVPPMSKSMVSAPAVSLASSMAALRVHCLPVVTESESHLSSAISASASSPVPLTVNVAAAAAAPENSEGQTRAGAVHE